MENNTRTILVSNQNIWSNLTHANWTWHLFLHLAKRRIKSRGWSAITLGASNAMNGPHVKRIYILVQQFVTSFLLSVLMYPWCRDVLMSYVHDSWRISARLGLLNELLPVDTGAKPIQRIILGAVVCLPTKMFQSFSSENFAENLFSSLHCPTNRSKLWKFVLKSILLLVIECFLQHSCLKHWISNISDPVSKMLCALCNSLGQCSNQKWRPWKLCKADWRMQIGTHWKGPIGTQKSDSRISSSDSQRCIRVNSHTKNGNRANSNC